MALFDLPLEKLQTHRSAAKPPKDFDAFWKRTLKETAGCELAPRFEKLDEPAYRNLDVYDVTYGGYRGQPIRAWYIRPAGAKDLPCVVTYAGYGGGRSLPPEHFVWSAAGLAVLAMDTRGQGGGWGPGHTGDPEGNGTSSPGYMTRGIEHPDTHYYRRVFTDGVRAVEAAGQAPGVDPKRIGVTGISQGGGITLAVAGLAGKKVKIAMADVPFLCDYRRATSIVDTSPYFEITQYLKANRDRVEQTFATLNYFDGVHFAARIACRTLVSVGLMDNICPPSTVYAAYNAIKAPKDIRVYHYNNHEGGGVFHSIERLRFATRWL